MKLLRAIGALIFYYLLGFLSGGIILGALALYIGISWLHQPQRSDNENVRQLLRWGRLYAQELNTLEDLQIQSKPNRPPLCQIVCNESLVNTASLVEEGAPALTRYWEMQRKQALRDPLFYLAMGKIEMASQAYPRALRETVLQELPPSKASRVLQAFQLEVGLGIHASKLALNLHSWKQNWRELRAFQDGVQSCRRGEKPKSQVLEECRKRIP
jgi:hypothetical protein